MLRALQVLQEQLAVQERLVKLARTQQFLARKDLKECKVPQELLVRQEQVLRLRGLQVALALQVQRELLE